MSVAEIAGHRRAGHLGGDQSDTLPPPPPELLVPLSLDEMMEVARRLEGLKTEAPKDLAAAEVTQGREVAAISSSSSDSQGTRPRLVLDLGYEWPAEARPARERQNAVVKQLHNFVDIVRTSQLEGSTHKSLRYPSVTCCGTGVSAVAARLEDLSPHVTCTENNVSTVFTGGSKRAAAPSGAACGDDAFPGGAAEGSACAREELRECEEALRFNAEVVYLSPDAPEILDTTQGYPRNTIFVVGGIVDRKVKRGRSAKRATDLKLRSVQLPLSSEQTGSPLNIDTVFSLLFYWWAFDNAPSSNFKTSPSADARALTSSRDRLSDEAGVGDAYFKARHCALHEHNTRHPNQGKHVL